MVQITDTTGANVVEVDPTLKAMRVTQRPMECLGWYSFGLKTGAMATLAAGSTLLSLRYTGSNLLAIRRIGMGAVTSVFSAAGLNDYAAYIARSFTGADSGGTSITLTGNNNKHRTSAAALSAGSLNVGTTAGLTVGTRTLDSQALGTQAYWSSVAGSNLISAPDNLFAHNEGDYPLLLAQNEGLIIENIALQATSSSVTCYFNLEMAEVTAY